MKRAALALALVTFGGCGSCESYQSNDTPAVQVGHEAKAVMLPRDNIVIARVGESGEPVTAWDVEFSARQTLGKLGETALDGPARRELENSVIASRAIAQLRQSEISPVELAKLDKKVAAYRERLLVESYIGAHAELRDIPESEMRAYYLSQRDKYGPKSQRSFELAFVELGKDPMSRGEFLRALGSVREADDWRAEVSKAQGEGVPMGFRRGDAELASLPKRLRDAALGLNEHEMSNVLMLGDRAYVVRVTKIGERPGKTFEEVRERIAKTLRPRATRDALLSIQDEVLSKVKIERADQES